MNKSKNLSSIMESLPSELEVRSTHAEYEGLGNKLTGGVLLAQVDDLVVFVRLLILKVRIRRTAECSCKSWCSCHSS